MPKTKKDPFKNAETRTLQTWPGGQSYSYQGDVDGPPEQRRLKDVRYSSQDRDAEWRPGTPEEWRAIRINVRALMYQDRDVLCCDSALVDDLIKCANAERMFEKDLGDAFQYEELRNMYKNPDDWDADTCREYLDDNGLDAPERPVCGHEHQADEKTDCPGFDLDADEDDSRGGYLTELRDACRDHAQDNPAEVFEWWRVTRWLCSQLDKIGEVTIDNGYGHWWGRTCTGQQYIMDGTLQEVAALFERPEV